MKGVWRGFGPTPPAEGGVGAAWQGRGFALGPRDRPQYSPDRRVTVSYVRTEGSPSALGGIALEGHVRHSASGLPPAEGEWVPLGRTEGSPSA